MNTLIFDQNQSKYKQLYQYFRREIEEGKLIANELMPSKRVLARQLGISLRTVEQAYEQLVAEGYLYGIERKGYFVSSLLNLVHALPSTEENQSITTREKVYSYSFSLSGVEEEGFPWSLMKRLPRQIVDEYPLVFLSGGDDRGEAVLRENIAHYLREARGFSPDPARIVISSGTEALLQLIFLLLSEDGLGLEDPGFSRLHTLCQDLGKKVYPLALDEEGIGIDELQASGANVAFITPSHQFPTGLVYPVGRRLELLSWAMEKEERFLIEDDYDSEFRYSVNPVPSLKSLDNGDKVIYLGSFSKSLSPSLKLSYLVLPQVLSKRMEKLPYWSCPVSLSTQLLISRFIEEGHYTRHLNRMRKIYKQKREILVEAILESDPKAKIGGSDAGLFITLIPDVQGTEEELVSRAKEKGIFVYGMKEFSLVSKSSHPQLLLGFASIKKESINEAVHSLYHAWRNADDD